MSKNKGRVQFLALVALFLLPMAIVGGLYWIEWNPGGASYGELIQPPRELKMTAIKTGEGKLFRPENWRNKWHLVQISHGGCDEKCQQGLYEMRQIHASLAKEIERLQRVWLIVGTMPTDEMNSIRAKYPDLVILPDADALVQQLAAAGQPADRFYLLDPLGKLMMRYPQEAEAKGIRKDLTKLLRYSWAG